MIDTEKTNTRSRMTTMVRSKLLSPRSLREARRDHDLLLSDVEQRFITNIYLKHICKGASDDQVQVALHPDVIDPICAKYAEDFSVTGSRSFRLCTFLPSSAEFADAE